MKTVLVMALAALTVTPAWAALSPAYQRAAEMRAVIDTATGILGPGGETIVTVNFLRADTYEVATENCVVIVNIVDVPPAKGAPVTVGPRLFEAAAEQFVC